MSPRNTDDGKSSANSSVKLHSPRSTNASMNPLTRRVMSASCSSMRLGANSGSSSLRYFECFGGSTLSGINGRTFRIHLDPRREQLVVAQHVLGHRSVEGQNEALGRLEQTGAIDHRLVVRLRRRQVEHRRQHFRSARLGSPCNVISHECPIPIEEAILRRPLTALIRQDRWPTRTNPPSRLHIRDGFWKHQPELDQIVDRPSHVLLKSAAST